MQLEYLTDIQKQVDIEISPDKPIQFLSALTPTRDYPALILGHLHVRPQVNREAIAFRLGCSVDVRGLKIPDPFGATDYAYPPEIVANNRSIGVKFFHVKQFGAGEDINFFLRRVPGNAAPLRVVMMQFKVIELAAIVT